MSISPPSPEPAPQAPSMFAEANPSAAPHAAPQAHLAPRWAKLLLLPAVVSVVLALDQGTKLLAQAELAEGVQISSPLPGGGTKVTKVWHPVRQVTVIPGLFTLRYVENPAAAFSLTSGLPETIRKPFLVLVTLLAMILIITWYWRTREPDWLVLAAFSFILGGAMGNLVDRIAYGYVIDFIDWHLSFLNPTWPHWPTFNIADSAICVGAAGVIWRTFKPYVQAGTASGEGSATRWSGSHEGLVEDGRTAAHEAAVELDGAARKSSEA